MGIVIEEYRKFLDKTGGYFGGLKITYCKPRSFSNEKVQLALDQCLESKSGSPSRLPGLTWSARRLRAGR